jgi:general L-amino acid transport system permease protein
MSAASPATRVTLIAPRAAPAHAIGAGAWLRRNLFSDWKNTLATLVVAALLIYWVPQLFAWAVLRAEVRPDVAACHALGQHGACWGVIAEKHRVILFGRYPYEEQWRPAIGIVLMIAMIVVSCVPRLWGAWLGLAWIANFVVFFLLLHGGFAGLAPVETSRWGGFPLTLLLSTLSIAAAFPLSVFIALGRRSHLPGIRAFCVAYVELIRGVPLISVLFMASFMFPLFMPPGTTPDVLLRVLVGIILFASAYLAEAVRGGLQAVPKGQIEAADSLGLTYWQSQRKIVLPQALRLVIPSIMNSFISTYKDTSLVTIVSLYDLTGGLTLALGGDADWRQYYLEGSLFVALIYWAGCFFMSRYSQWIEQRVNADQAR